MRLSVLALSLANLCIPSVVIAQDVTTTTPGPETNTPTSADCSGLSGTAAAECNALRQQQDMLNNSSNTPGAQDSLDSTRESLDGTTESLDGTTGGASGTLNPTTPDGSLGAGGGSSDGGGGLGSSGGGSSGGGSSGGGL